MPNMMARLLRGVSFACAAAALGGCDMAVLGPSGDIALRERNLIITSTILMLLIIVPVIATTLIFARRYRASNADAIYDPDWHHSTQLEVWIWTAPLLIIVALGAITWMGTHLLDPFRPLDRLGNNRVLATDVRPVKIQVVALDWKWLFFYPDQGIATVNEIAVPIDTPVNFEITSATVMNSFFIPSMAGQIYAMAGMQTKLSIVANEAGMFNGLSSQYSGSGFSHMNFAVESVTREGFEAWVAKVKAKGSSLDQKSYDALRKPSEEVPHLYYASFRPHLFHDILNMCASPGKMCQSEMMKIDAMGGGGKDSEANRARLVSDAAMGKEGVEAPAATFPASGRAPNTLSEQPQGMKSREVAPAINNHAPPAGGDADHPADHSPAPAQLNQR